MSITIEDFIVAFGRDDKPLTHDGQPDQAKVDQHRPRHCERIPARRSPICNVLGAFALWHRCVYTDQVKIMSKLNGSDNAIRVYLEAYVIAVG